VIVPNAAVLLLGSFSESFTNSKVSTVVAPSSNLQRRVSIVVDGSAVQLLTFAHQNSLAWLATEALDRGAIHDNVAKRYW
jgi:hypothetical protein